MKEIEAQTEQHRTQSNAIVVAYLCPNCKKHLAYLSAGPDPLTIETTNRLHLQIDESFVWSDAENCFLRPKNFSGIPNAKHKDKKLLEVALHQAKQQLANDGWTEETKAQMETFKADLEELTVEEKIRLKEYQAELIAANPSLYDVDRSRFKKEMDETIHRLERYLAEFGTTKRTGPQSLHEAEILTRPEQSFLCCGQLVKANLQAGSLAVIRD
jgi:hypothetical protein